MPYIGRSEKFGVRNRFYYTQSSGGATSISGADDAGKTLTFTDGAYVDVFLNGIALVAGTDYNTTTADTIAGLSALSGGDIIEVLVYDVFNVADTVSAASGGTFSGGVTMGGTLSVTGALTATTGTFSGAVSMGANNITFSNGNGIDFSATAGSGASSSILDDYEEGTWTPSIGGNATYTTQTGYYTRVGNLVLCIYDININVIGTGSTSIMTGFPFTAANLTSGPVSYYAGIATNVYSLDSYIINGSTNMYYTGHTTASGNIGNNLTVFQNSARIVGAVTYRV
jgi:hypothetical protein